MMNNLKKVLALVLVFAMSLSVVAFAGAVYPDVADDATYAEAVTILKSLGIMQGDEQGNFNPDKTVTRGEMATILCNLAGVGEQAPVDTGFADTTAAHWASGYVAYAKNAGWINGYDENSFGPDDVVKYEQAIKLVMAVANWGIYAEENGGYPTGWLMAAAEAEVTKAGAAGAVNEDCTRAKIAMILYYALDANIMKQTSFGEKKWEIIEGETILSKNLDTYKVEGKVDNTYKHDSSIEEGYVDYMITKTNGIDVETKLGATAETYTDDEGKKVATGNYLLKDIDAAGTGAADLLAYSTIAYIHVDDDDEATLVAIAPKGTKNKVYEIADMDLVWNREEDLDSRESRNTNLEDPAKFRFCYWLDRDADNYVSSVKLDPSVKIVENSNAPWSLNSLDATTDEILADIIPAIGNITLVDTDNDGYVDLIEIKSYEVAVVDSVNAARQRIIFKERTAGIGGNITFDTEVNTELTDVTMTLDGKDIAIEDLAENDVLTISTNSKTEPRYYDIIVTRNSVTGKVNSLNDAKEIIYIDSVEYEVVEGLVDFSAIGMNDEGVFYLDAAGNIAYIDDTTVASTNYAIVDKYVVNTDWDTVSMKVLTLDGTKLTADVAEQIKLNGVKVKLLDVVAATKLADMGIVVEDGELAVDADGNYTATYSDLIKAIVEGDIDLIDAGEAKLGKLITYDVSGDEIDEITFAIDSSDTKKFGYVTKTSGSEWQADNYRFQGSKTLSDKTVVINMAGTIDDWKIASAANLIDENVYSPYFFANQTDGTVGVVVIFDSASTVNQDASLAYFVDYRSGVYEVNGDEEDVVYVNYYVDGALATEALPVDESEFVSMEIGDAFLYAVNDKGIVDTIVPVFSAANGKFSSDIGKEKTDLDDFMMYDATLKLDNEVYFGLLVKAGDGKLTVAPAPVGTETSVSFDSFQNIAVPSTAKVLQYKSYVSDAKKLAACETIVDLEVSSYTKTNGSDINLGVENEDGEVEVDSEAYTYLTYVFFRMNNGTVTEVVGIDYNRN